MLVSCHPLGAPPPGWPGCGGTAPARAWHANCFPLYAPGSPRPEFASMVRACEEVNIIPVIRRSLSQALEKQCCECVSTTGAIHTQSIVPIRVVPNHVKKHFPRQIQPHIIHTIHRVRIAQRAEHTQSIAPSRWHATCFPLIYAHQDAPRGPRSDDRKQGGMIHPPLQSHPSQGLLARSLHNAHFM